MSMHKKPLTQLEIDGLNKHHLYADRPSQLSDCFRLGVKWSIDNYQQDELNELRKFRDLAFLAHPNIGVDIDNLTN